MTEHENTVDAVHNFFCNSIKDNYESEECSAIAKEVIQHYSGHTWLQLKLDKKMLPMPVVEKIKTTAAKIQNGKPMQYVLGVAHWYKYAMKVNEDVLIPRPETEELVQWVLQENDGQKKAIDIGTGSGCIAIALKDGKPNWEVSAMDISKEALAVARENAVSYKADINWHCDDILNPAKQYATKYDLVVSNPPYITSSEARHMAEHVLKHEPHLALFVSNNDALQFYKAILLFCQSNLEHNGAVYMECNREYAVQVEALFKPYFGRVELRKDMHGNYRMLHASGLQVENFLQKK